MMANGSYLHRARLMGWLATLDGVELVVGRSRDPETHEVAAFVEHMPEQLWPILANPKPLEALALERVSDARSVLLRIDAQAVSKSPGLRPITSYIILESPYRDDPPQTESVEDVTGDSVVEEWLIRAMSAASPQLPLTSIEREASLLASAPSFRSFGVRNGRELSASASFQAPVLDSPSGLQYLELLDIWVDDPDVRYRLTSQLVQAVSLHASSLGLPVIGNVSHDQEAPAHSEAVLQALLERGWQRFYDIVKIDLSAHE